MYLLAYWKIVPKVAHNMSCFFI